MATPSGRPGHGLAGVQLTIPHKVAVIEHLDRLSPAAAIGAVNCVVHRDGELVGENTDGKGFLVSLVGRRPARDVAGDARRRGASRAIAVELALAGPAESPSSTAPGRGEALAR